MNRSTIRVRPATPADEQAVPRIEAAATKQLRAVYAPTDRTRRRAGQAAPSLVRLVAEDESGVVGTVRFRTESDRLHLVGLMVDPAHQGQGVGRALVEDAVERARGLGLGRVTLFTVAETGNEAIFVRMGFTTVDRTPAAGLIGVDGKKLHELQMQREVGGL